MSVLPQGRWWHALLSIFTGIMSPGLTTAAGLGTGPHNVGSHPIPVSALGDVRDRGNDRTGQGLRHAGIPAVGVMNVVVADHPQHESSRQAQYNAALTSLELEQYPAGIKIASEFLERHADDALAPNAQFLRAECRLLSGQTVEAEKDYAELLKKYPKAQRAPEGMLKLGLALFELGQMKEGCAALAALPAKYPDASAAVATRARTERTGAKCK